jgi:hypothetical protein
MLQCSNYKAGPAASVGLRASFHATFTKIRALLLPSCRAHVICPMAYAAYAQDLRNLVWVAAKLRVLAAETRAQGDQLLYLMTAEALEKRAERLAAAPPREHDDQDAKVDAPWRHQPVDLII